MAKGRESGTRKASYLCGIAALALTVAAPAATYAQDAEELDTIYVKSNYNKDRFAEAADRNFSTYISEKAIKEAQSGDLKDLFAEEASITVGGGIPIAQKIFVNGVDMLNLNVTIDGAMQNNRSFHHVTANAIDPGLLKAVRVDAGIAAADSGPNATAGSVAFQTKDALDFLKGDDKFGGRVLLSADSNSLTFSEALTLYGRNQGFDILGYVKNARGQDYEAGDGKEIAGSKAALQSLLLKGGYSAENGNRFEASAQILKDTALRPYRANFGSFRGASPIRLYETSRKSMAFNFNTEAPTDLWDPEVVLGYSENDIRVPVPYGSKGVSSTVNAKIANTFHFAQKYGITVGVDAYNKEATYTDPRSNNKESATNIGAFVQARLQPIEPLKLSLGGRYDSQDFDGVSHSSGKDLNVSGFSGNASVAYEVVDGLTLKAGYANIFGGIDLEDNFTFEPGWDYSGLKASRAQNVSAGVSLKKWDFIATAEVFRNDVKNARSTTYNYRTRTTTRNNVDFVTKGFNLGLGYYWMNGHARISYSNTEIEVNGTKSDSYNALDLGTPLGEVIAFNIAHTFEPYDLTVGGSVDAALDFKTGSNVSDKKIEGYTAVNLFAEYEPKQIKGLSIRLNANNIFDEDYADRAAYGGDFGVVGEFKEPGRSFLATVRYDF